MEAREAPPEGGIEDYAPLGSLCRGVGRDLGRSVDSFVDDYLLDSVAIGGGEGLGVCNLFAYENEMEARDSL